MICIDCCTRQVFSAKFQIQIVRTLLHENIKYRTKMSYGMDFFQTKTKFGWKFVRSEVLDIFNKIWRFKITKNLMKIFHANAKSNDRNNLIGTTTWSKVTMVSQFTRKSSVKRSSKLRKKIGRKKCIGTVCAQLFKRLFEARYFVVTASFTVNGRKIKVSGNNDNNVRDYHCIHAVYFSVVFSSSSRPFSCSIEVTNLFSDGMQ